MRIAIVGAGIVGLAAAHELMDRGHAVTLVDPGAPDGRPSDGNAGWIAHTDILPLASPKVWRHLPRWLADPLGPLAIRPAYLPRLVPWLWRFVVASAPARVEASIQAIRALNALALPAWQRRLAALDLGGHLRPRGCLHVWSSRAAFARAEGLLARQRAFGIAVESLDAAGVAALEPALRNVEAAAYYPEACHVSDPRAVAADLLARALDRGAVRVTAAATAIEPGEAGPQARIEPGAPVACDRLVLAAGIWSRPLAHGLGDAIPLDTERGYNATYEPGTFGLSRPVTYEGEGFVTSPLDIGDRIGGAVEFAGLDAAPNHGRTAAMARRLQRYLPGFDPGRPARRWMGFRPSIPDSRPVIGPARRDGRVVYAFGHGHYGLTQAAATAMLVADLIEGRPPAIDVSPFSPQRF